RVLREATGRAVLAGSGIRGWPAGQRGSPRAHRLLLCGPLLPGRPGMWREALPLISLVLSLGRDYDHDEGVRVMGSAEYGLTADACLDPVPGEAGRRVRVEWPVR